MLEKILFWIGIILITIVFITSLFAHDEYFTYVALLLFQSFILVMILGRLRK